MQDRLKEIQERADKATEGPWKGLWRGNAVKSHYVWAPVCRKNICSSISPKTNDAEFIAHARQDIPYLLAALRAEMQKVAELQSIAKTQSQTINMMEEQNTALHNGLEVEKIKVNKMRNIIKKLKDVITVLNCMIFCGEQHSDRTETMVNDALGFESIKRR